MQRIYPVNPVILSKKLGAESADRSWQALVPGTLCPSGIGTRYTVSIRHWYQAHCVHCLASSYESVVCLFGFRAAGVGGGSVWLRGAGGGAGRRTLRTPGTLRTAAAKHTGGGHARAYSRIAFGAVGASALCQLWGSFGQDYGIFRIDRMGAARCSVFIL